MFITLYTLKANFEIIDSIPIGIETIFILIFSFYYLFEQMNNPKVIFLYNNYRFWVIIGMMLYLSGSFFIYIFANRIPYEQVADYWFVIDIFLILKNLFFLTAMLVFALQPTKKTPPQIPTFKSIP